MPIDRMDHFTILTTDTEETVAFYYDVLGLTPGPRPDFSFPGAWLYNGGNAVLHVVEKAVIPDGGGVLDHIAFRGTDAPVLPRQAQGARRQIRPAPVAAIRPRRGDVAIVLLRPERRPGRDRLCGDGNRGGAGLSARG